MSYLNFTGIGATAGSVVPGVGTGIGAAAGAIIDFVSSLFGKPSKDVANDQFIDGLVAYAQSKGFQGFTHEDVVHLMIANWGSNYNAAAQAFASYLNQFSTGAVNTNLYGTVVMPASIFGGGYVPNHEIIFTGTPSIQTGGVISSGVPTTGGITSGVNKAGMSGLLIFLLLGGAAGAVYLAAKHG